MLKKDKKLNPVMLAAVIDTIQINLKLKQIDAQKAAIIAKRQSIQSQIDVFEEQIKNLKTNEKRIAQMVKDGAATQKQLDDITGQINVIEKQIASTRTQFTIGEQRTGSAANPERNQPKIYSTAVSLITCKWHHFGNIC